MTAVITSRVNTRGSLKLFHFVVKFMKSKITSAVAFQ